ncbi:MAG: cytochrome C oxidase subunit II [Chloroflexi bacterium]|nr:cytochrome C oxidase subunit II [Chloroflexota bacterium]
MPLTPPQPRNWWDLPLGGHEKIWLSIVVLLGLSMFVMMPVWHVFGAQNSPTETYRVSPDYYWEKATKFAAAEGGLSRKVEAGIQPTGDDVYLGALKFGWFPNVLVLEAGRRYRIHVSSKDVNHGFSIHKAGEPSQKANFQVVPGYEHVLPMTFTEAGTYDIVCQEYCGLGHQFMLGRILVERGR